jgi:hypothetical protein
MKDWLMGLGYGLFLFVDPGFQVSTELREGRLSYLCTPETKCYCASCAVADFLSKQSRIGIILNRSEQLLSDNILTYNNSSIDSNYEVKPGLNSKIRRFVS